MKSKRSCRSNIMFGCEKAKIVGLYNQFLDQFQLGLRRQPSDAHIVDLKWYCRAVSKLSVCCAFTFFSLDKF